MTATSKPLFIILALLSLLFIDSCSKVCDEGYEGKRCDEELRDHFEGIWTANDNPGGLTFTDTITEGTGVLDILIQKHFGTDSFNRPVKATITATTINIAKQKPQAGKDLMVQGSGTLVNDNTINWNYLLINTTIDTLPDTTSFTGVWTKQ